MGANWFNREMVRKVGNGETTRFWLDHWVGNEALYLTFPRLFSISSQKEAMVGEVWVDGDWNLTWRRSLFVWEEGLIHILLDELEGREVSEPMDSWWWKLEEGGIFSVSSSYSLLVKLQMPLEPLENTKAIVFGRVWHPLKWWFSLGNRSLIVSPLRITY